MIGNRVAEHYYRNWIYQDCHGTPEGSWYFIDNRFEDHGPFVSYEAACKGVDEYLRSGAHDKGNTETS